MFPFLIVDGCFKVKVNQFQGWLIFLGTI